ncbi:MAG TPA: DNA repair protein RecO [Bacteroidia bacterium]|jgi:DNA repair protein RecO (recombination protein O)|nr:DNA repair protein RecO [Bacteroidia bacterium]
MLATTRGIIFHTVPYSDSRVIAKVYTREKGIESFIITVSRSKKGKVKSSVLQPLTQVEFVVDRRERNDLQYVREVSCYAPYSHLQEDVIKTSIALFIAEVLYRSVKEEESNPGMYSFIENSLHILDLHHEGVANFHLCFLVQLSKYLGFYPQQNTAGDKSVFDLRDGVFRNSIPPHPLYLEVNESRLLEHLMEISYDTMHTLLITGETRSMMVKHLLRYYELHLHSMQEVKSHYVLEAVLN